jgi:hypothetical protein
MGAEAVCRLSLISFRDDFFLKIPLGRRMKRSSRRRSGSEKRSGVAKKKSVDRQRSANRSSGRRRSSSVRCAKKWSGLNARRGIGLPLLGAVAVCGAYAVRVHLCARVPQREEARDQVRHSSNSKFNYAYFFLIPPPVRCEMLMFSTLCY